MTEQANVKREDVGRRLAGPQLLSIPTTDNTVIGPSYVGTAGTTITAGQVVVLQADGFWDPSDANTAALYRGPKGIAMNAALVTEELLVALPGSICKSSGFIAMTAGLPYFVSETVGVVTATVPTSGTSATILAGEAFDADVLYVKMTAAVVITGA